MWSGTGRWVKFDNLADGADMYARMVPAAKLLEAVHSGIVRDDADSLSELLQVVPIVDMIKLTSK